MSEEERTALHAEIRAVLLAHPEIIERAFTLPLYEDDVSNDLALFAKHAATLFGGHDIAFIVGASCADCADAAAELDALAKARGLTVNHLDIGQHPDIARDFEIDTLPFYVLPDMMLRGAMPAAVLERYLSKP